LECVPLLGLSSLLCVSGHSFGCLSSWEAAKTSNTFVLTVSVRLEWTKLVVIRAVTKDKERLHPSQSDIQLMERRQRSERKVEARKWFSVFCCFYTPAHD
jgi:hypothetical protein